MADDRVEEFTAGRAIQVPLPSVEKELAKLWREAGESQKGAAGRRRGLTRACLWNLVVRVHGERGLVRAKAAIDAISPSLPARVLVLDTREDEPPHPVRAWIEANWHASDGGASQIGSEEVTLMAAGASVEDLPQVVRALTVPDVPTAALWLGAAPSEESALDRELGFADRLILDGDGAALHAVGAGTGGVAGLVRLAAFVSRRRDRAGESGLQGSSDVTDIAWLRGGPARSLVASLFEPPCAPDAADAFAVDDATIACRPDRLGTALLSAGWLASRLGWTEPRSISPAGSQTGSHGSTLRFRRKDGRAVQVHLRREPEAAEPLARIELHSRGGRYAVTFNERAVILESPSLAWKEPLSVPSEPELWIAALGAAGRDPLYRTALALLARAA